MATSSQISPFVKSEFNCWSKANLQVGQTNVDVIEVKPRNAITLQSKRVEFLQAGKFTDFKRRLFNTPVFFKLIVTDKAAAKMKDNAYYLIN